MAITLEEKRQFLEMVKNNGLDKAVRLLNMDKAPISRLCSRYRRDIVEHDEKYITLKESKIPEASILSYLDDNGATATSRKYKIKYSDIETLKNSHGPSDVTIKEILPLRIRVDYFIIYTKYGFPNASEWLKSKGYLITNLDALGILKRINSKIPFATSILSDADKRTFLTQVNANIGKITKTYKLAPTTIYKIAKRFKLELEIAE